MPVIVGVVLLVVSGPVLVGAAGAVVSMVNAEGGETGLVFPAASVARATSTTVPSDRVVVGVTAQVPAALAGSGADFAACSLRCFLFGVLISAPLGTLLWFISRVDRLALSSLIFVAGEAGVGANLALHAHCPVSYPGHLIAGHATVALAWLLALALVNRLQRAR